MKNRNLAYWVTTSLFALGLTMSGIGALTHQPAMVEGYTHLGYPIYFMSMLGVAKLLGAATLVAPKLPRLKEWAYAGFTINLGSAVLSHVASGDGAGQIAAPVVLLTILAGSYALRPASRTLASPSESARQFERVEAIS